MGLSLVISVPADALVSDSARLSAGIVLTENWNIFPSKIVWLRVNLQKKCGPDDTIQNCQRHLEKSQGTSNANS